MNAVKPASVYNIGVAVPGQNSITRLIRVKITEAIITGIAFAAAIAVPVCAETSAAPSGRISTPDEYNSDTGEVCLESCLIDSKVNFMLGVEREKANYVVISGSSSDHAEAFGHKTRRHPELYLFELKAYQDDIGECEGYAARIGVDKEISVELPLMEDTGDSRLFSKFVLARKSGGEYHEVSNRIYVTNPEYIAESNIAYGDPPSKKGLLVDFSMTDDAVELGVKRVIINIDFAQFMSEGTEYEEYDYDGCTYEFNEAVVAEYDRVISDYSGREMQVTAVVLNAYNENTPELRYDRLNFEDDLEKMEEQQGADHLYYHFSTNTAEGMTTTAALASFLAERYSGESREYGRVSNWIIGNEINNPNRWNYMGDVDFDSYIKEYARSFRVFYNAMKSKSANAKLFFSIDYDWVYRAGSGPDVKYGGKDVVDSLNTLFIQDGNIDWNLAYHPYSSPMSEPEFWNNANCTDSEESPIINFKNLHVLTDYLAGEDFHNTKGIVRDIILSEQGFTSVSETRGECQELQAAAFAYAYYIADSNEYIDAFILNRQVDAPVEMEDGLYFGLWTCNPDGSAAERKYIWDVFKDIDNKDMTLEVTAFARPLIGIEKWSDVIPDFKPDEESQQAAAAPQLTEPGGETEVSE